MRYIILALCLAGFHFATAQDLTRIYYDKYHDEVEKEKAYYYSERSKGKRERDTTRTYYYPANTLRSEESFKDGRAEGLHLTYFENGDIQTKKMYLKGRPYGESAAYYPGKKPQSIILYYDSSSFDSHLLQYWDSVGNQLIKDGNGFCRCILQPESRLPLMFVGKVVDGKKDSLWAIYRQDNSKYGEEWYKNDELISGVSFDKDGNRYEYSMVMETAQPDGGMAAFYRFVAQRMRYPKEAKKKGVEGRVFVQFIVEKDGSLSNVKVVKGIGGGCDEEAVASLTNAPRWKPGKQRGQSVRQKMVLPITFKLG